MRAIRAFLLAAAILLGGSLLASPNAYAINFNPAPESPLTGLGPDGRGAVSGDFGGDARDDIVSISRAHAGGATGGGIYMLLNDGDGTFTETEKSTCAPEEDSPCDAGWLLAGIYKADFDQDGNDDVLTIRSGLDRLTVWRGDGEGHLGYGGSMDPARPLPGVDSLDIGDVNQDDYPDIVVGYDGGDFGVHVNMGVGGPGMFSSASPPVQSITGAGANDKDYFGSVAIGDYNGGGVDIALGQVACTVAGPGCATPFPASNAVFVADGDGSPINFIGANGNPHAVGAGKVITDIAKLDIEHHEDPEMPARTGLAVATTSGSGGEITTLVGSTNLTLMPNPGEQEPITADSEVSALVSSQLDTGETEDLAWLEDNAVGVALQSDEGSLDIEPRSPFDRITDGHNFSTLAVGAFMSNGAAGFALGGLASEDLTGSVEVLLPATDFRASGLDFGEVATGASKTLPLEFSNQSVFGEYVMSLEISGGSAADFTLSDHAGCENLALDQGDSCTVQVTFSPQATGSREAQLVINRDGDQVTLPLLGTAIDPADPDPDPDPDPEPETRIKLKLGSPGKVGAGGKVRIKATVRNTGNQTVRNLALLTRVPKKQAKRPGKKTIRSLAPGAVVRRTIVVKVRPKAKRGKRIRIGVVAKAAGKVLASARKPVRVRR